MSTATIKDLIPGEAAASADVNSTLSSFVTACAAGAINGDNVRVEGIDRRTLSAAGHVVESWYADPVNSGSASGNVQNVSGSYITVDTATPLVTASATIPSTTRVLLHASLFVTGDPQAAALPELDLVLQSSVDAGVSWSTLTATRRRFGMANTNNLCDRGAGNNVPGINASISWCVVVTATGQATLYRVGYQTTAHNFNFQDGTIFLETLDK